MKPRTVAETVDRVLALVKPGPANKPVGYVASNEHPAACRFCDDPCIVEVLNDGDRVRVAITHEVPLCPEFVRSHEDQE